MNEHNELPNAETERRCPHCDTVVEAGATRCVMCGATLDDDVVVETTAVSSPPTVSQSTPSADHAPAVVESVMRERRSSIFFWLTAAVVVVFIGLGAWFLRFRGDELAVALVPTLTPIPPTPTYTPTWTPLPTDTPAPTAVPTETPVPPPTDTPQPPRFHDIAAGETLYGISLLYRIAAESIAEANGFTVENPQVQAGLQLQIPWPTATPPLESILIEVDDRTFLADVTDCQMYSLEPGDSLLGLAGKFDVPAEAIVQVNRLTQERIDFLQPGDTFCVPKIVNSDMLPPTPGPSPTPTATSYPAGPSLLYPVNETVIEPADKTLTLQWVAVKDLGENEWYMVELTDEDVADSLPLRDFTRDTSFKVPPEWRPALFEPESHQFRWRVSIVQVTGERADGVFTYTYGGRASGDAYFTWLSATPTPTPTPTPLPTATPTLEP